MLQLLLPLHPLPPASPAGAAHCCPLLLLLLFCYCLSWHDLKVFSLCCSSRLAPIEGVAFLFSMHTVPAAAAAPPASAPSQPHSLPPFPPLLSAPSVIFAKFVNVLLMEFEHLLCTRVFAFVILCDLSRASRLCKDRICMCVCAIDTWGLSV